MLILVGVIASPIAALRSVPRAVLAACQEVGSYRGAADMCGTTHETVKRIVERHNADAWPAAAARTRRSSPSAGSILVVIWHLLADPSTEFVDLGPPITTAVEAPNERSAPTSAACKPSATQSPSAPPPDPANPIPAALRSAGRCRTSGHRHFSN
jgi:hypothetical protein